jgi:formylglycine-generating enzyme required for sulfatase activity
MSRVSRRIAWFLMACFGILALARLPAAADPATLLQPYTEKIPDTTVSFDMIPIPAGTFLMGSPDSEPGRKPDEGPQREVRVGAFWMEKCETTWDMYDLFWKEEGLPEAGKPPAPQYGADAITRPTPPYSDETFGHGREGHPVLGVTHHSAMMFCRWLSKKTGKKYRLPTEAEWEYACRAGTKTAYPFGDDPAQLGDYAWYKANAEDTTHPIGKKKPNAWGLHDMLGNVSEWCLDHYSTKDYANWPAGKTLDRPVRVPTDVKYSHVVRGGSWAEDAAAARSASRRGSEKSWLRQDPQRPQSIWWMTDADFVGFRVVRAVDEQPELKDLLPRVNWTSKEFAE